MSRNKRAVKIAGAGPAGLTAAICLAKAGYDVQIYEARESVGARFMGDFQVLENASGAPDPMEMLQKIGIATNFFVRPLSQATLFDHRLRPCTVSSATPFAYMIRRGQKNHCANQHSHRTLDTGLMSQAVEAGVSIQYKTRIPPDEADIIATGPKVADGLAKEMTFMTDHPNTTWVLFDQQYAPGGYAYLFICDGLATFGCAVTHNLHDINHYFDRSLARFFEISPFTIQNAQIGYSFMDFRLKSSAMDKHRIYIGEAGGFQDYLFGLGLRYAFMTGYFAAISFIEKKGYDDLWKKEMRQSQEISLVNRALYEWGGNWGLAAFVRRAQGQDFQKYLTGWQTDRSWKRALLPLVKWAWERDSPCRHPTFAHWCRCRGHLETTAPAGRWHGHSEAIALPVRRTQTGPAVGVPTVGRCKDTCEINNAT